MPLPPGPLVHGAGVELHPGLLAGGQAEDHQDGGDEQDQHRAGDVRQIRPLPLGLHHDVLIELEPNENDAEQDRREDQEVADLGRGLRRM